MNIWNGLFKKGTVSTYTTDGDFVRALAWSPNGKFLLSTSTLYGSKLWFGEVDKWNTSTGERNSVIKMGQSSAISSVSWACDSTRIALGTDDGMIEVWDTNMKKLLQGPYHVALRPNISWSPDGMQLATGANDGQVRIWQVSDKNTCIKDTTWIIKATLYSAASVFFIGTIAVIVPPELLKRKKYRKQQTKNLGPIQNALNSLNKEPVEKRTP